MQVWNLVDQEVGNASMTPWIGLQGDLPHDDDELRVKMVD